MLPPLPAPLQIAATNAEVKSKVANALYQSRTQQTSAQISALQSLTSADHGTLSKMASSLVVQAQSAGVCDGNFVKVIINGKPAGGGVKVSFCEPR